MATHSNRNKRKGSRGPGEGRTGEMRGYSACPFYPERPTVWVSKGRRMSAEPRENLHPGASPVYIS